MAVKKSDILDRVKEAQHCNRLSCKKALELADKLGVPPKRIGDAANELKIKISACQLGCFK